jgi:hypothetical protein
MTTSFTKKFKKDFFPHSYISYLCNASEKSMIKPLLNFLQHGVPDQVKFREKGLSTMAAIRVKTMLCLNNLAQFV